MRIKTTRYSVVSIAAIISSCMVVTQSHGQSTDSRQNGFMTIQGTVKDSLLTPLPLATVTLFKTGDTSAIQQTLTDTTGIFLFKKITEGTYYITASSAGYTTYKSAIFTVKSEEKTTRLPLVILKQQTTVLKDVTVTSTSRKFIEAGAGKLTLNVEQSAVAAGSSAFELLQRAPGVTVDQNDNVLLRGSAGVNVMIDGKMTYLSAQQLSNTLKSMPVENISKIEVITRPGAQYDAAGNMGIINIITKKLNRLGYAANISAGIGFGHFVTNTENVTGNVKTKWFIFFGSLGYDVVHNYKTLHNTQISTTDNSDTYYFFNAKDIIHSNDYSYKAGADFYLTKKQQVGFVVSSSLDDWNRHIEGQTDLLNDAKQPFSYVLDSTIAIEPYYNNTYESVALNTKDSLRYHFIPAGSFLMGCVPGDTSCEEEDKLQHSVVIEKGFCMSETEITVAVFRKFVQATGYVPASIKCNKGRMFVDSRKDWAWITGLNWKHPFDATKKAAGKLPVVQVTWDDAVAYCKWAGGRLPEEEEWEYAARGGLENKKYPWGDDWLPFKNNKPLVNTDDKATLAVYPSMQGINDYDDGFVVTAPVASFPPNGYGLYDMAGNAWEFTNTRFLHGYGTTDTDSSFIRHDTRIVRGGAWCYYPY